MLRFGWPPARAQEEKSVTKHMRTMATLLLAACTLLALAGCGGDGLTDVTGTVTIDGAPLAAGDIVFEAADKNSAPQGATITGGQFQLRISPGQKIVRINASEGDGVVDPLMKTEGRRSIIPAEFNTSSTLTAEIKPGPNPPLTFAVKKATNR
jgi:hypothetical protein